MSRQRNLFTAEYEARLADHPAAGTADHTFGVPDAGTRSVLVEVEPWSGTSWTGSFAAGEPLGRGSVSGLFPTPNPARLCVVERGTAFLVDVLDPAATLALPAGDPVTAVRPIPEEQLLLLIGRWSIVAVGAAGVAWETDRIAIDGLRVDESEDGLLRGVADPDDEEPRDFAVDLRTGSVIGGAGIS